MKPSRFTDFKIKGKSQYRNSPSAAISQMCTRPCLQKYCRKKCPRGRPVMVCNKSSSQRGLKRSPPVFLNAVFVIQLLLSSAEFPPIASQEPRSTGVCVCVRAPPHPVRETQVLI
uniref:Uncharacterized protein n=1 Tax=Micrurus spixii TaxID=129469 RepID=A0A2D4MF76_9SAUR